ncbi:MAG TPA: hypothetical protein PKW52_11305 [Nitrospira sp.]|nr:hypothetical protein [Nitrospira sp. NTP1]HQV11922.1 hypothetical protein [Nitrospira sp.]
MLQLLLLEREKAYWRAVQKSIDPDPSRGVFFAAREEEAYGCAQWMTVPSLNFQGLEHRNV